MRYFIASLFIIIGGFWLGSYAVGHSVDVTINWGDWGSITLTSTFILILLILGFIASTLFIIFLWYAFGLRSKIQNRRHIKLVEKASNELTSGLIHFTEGHWKRSESMLLNSVEYSKTPLLNYLAAARAAHMQEAYDRRDSYLKKASEHGDEAQVAVSVSQAEMQFFSNQFEQARATLIHLLEISPKHPHAIKLLAKVYYQQEDWSNLFALLPELDKQSLIKESDREKYERTALMGIFHMLAHKKELSQLQILWKKLPENIRKRPTAILLYCDALTDAGDKSASDNLLSKTLAKSWDESLIERYGLIKHKNLNSAIKQAQAWLETHPKSPMLLLSLARLLRDNQQLKESKDYFISSLNLSASAGVYLELAKLLEDLEEHDNAEICYKQGLKYSINHEGEILNLQ